MPPRDEICRFVREYLDQSVQTPNDLWVAIYRLLLDYEHGVPRITDSNRLKQGIWRRRAQYVEQALAAAMGCQPSEVVNQVDELMRRVYVADTQRMNPVGIAFACATVYLIERFSRGDYTLMMEALIGREVFPNLRNFRRKAVDITAFHEGETFAVISSKWGIRHDRVRDPQEEADTYKQQAPRLRFFVVTNEFDSARLQKVLTWPTIDGVFHVRRDLVWQVYGSMAPPTQQTATATETPNVILPELMQLKDLTELITYFP